MHHIPLRGNNLKIRADTKYEHKTTRLQSMSVIVGLSIVAIEQSVYMANHISIAF